jgi:hypothetical protein
MQRGDDPAEGAERLPPSRQPDRRASAVWQQRRGAHTGRQMRSQAEQETQGGDYAPLHVEPDAQAPALRGACSMRGSMAGQLPSMD